MPFARKGNRAAAAMAKLERAAASEDEGGRVAAEGERRAQVARPEVARAAPPARW